MHSPSCCGSCSAQKHCRCNYGGERLRRFCVGRRQPEKGMAGAFPVNATVVDPSTKTVHREVPAMVPTIRLIERRIGRRGPDSRVGEREVKYAGCMTPA